MTDRNRQQSNLIPNSVAMKMASLSDEDLTKLSDDQKLQLAESLGKEAQNIYPEEDQKIDLTDPQSAALLKRVVGQLELQYEPSTARDFVKRLSQRLLEENSKISPSLLSSYEEFILRAKFTCLDILEEEDIEDLIKNSLIKYWTMPVMHVGVIDKLRQSFVRFLWPPDTEPFTSKIRGALESNEEMLGLKNLMILGDNGKESAKPTIKNWLKDYLSFQIGLRVGNEVAKDAGNTFGRISYINKKASSYSLPKEQRGILVQILELDDWLRFGWKDEFEQESKESFVPDEIKEIMAQLSDTVTEEEQREQSLATGPQPPKIPMPKNQFPQKRMEEIQPIPNTKFQISNEGTLALNRTDNTNRINRTDTSVMPSRVNIQDILNSREPGQAGVTGLKMGDGGGENISNFKLSSSAPNFAEASSGKKSTEDLRQISNEGTASKTLTPALAEREENTRDKNPSSFILNPLLEKKLTLQNAPTKQQEIDRKLEELHKRIK